MAKEAFREKFHYALKLYRHWRRSAESRTASLLYAAFHILHIRSARDIYINAGIVGAFMGGISIFFYQILALLEKHIGGILYPRLSSGRVFSERLTYPFENPVDALFILLVPALGGLIVGFITYYFSKAAAGSGTHQVIEAFHRRRALIRSRIILFKPLTTAFTLSSGGSGGIEGPIAQIGAALGSVYSKYLRSGDRARRTLFLCGVAGGLGALFHAPLGGALTAAEMVYKEDIESDALLPAFISSVTAYLIFSTSLGGERFLEMPELGGFHLIEILSFSFLGVLCFFYGWLFIRGHVVLQRKFQQWKIYPPLKPALGGLLTGLILIFFSEVSGTGSLFLKQMVAMRNFIPNGGWQVAAGFFIIALLKVLATNLTIASGGSAGVFGPSLFIGGALGVGTGVLFLSPLGLATPQIAAYAVVGMGAFYAGVANAPLAGIVLVSEIAGTYLLLPPLILVSIFTYVLARRMELYPDQPRNRFYTKAHDYDRQQKWRR